MIVLGLILLIAGFVLKISILWTIGVILLVVGARFWRSWDRRDALSADVATTSNRRLLTVDPTIALFVASPTY
jgi:hypothetical protein